MYIYIYIYVHIYIYTYIHILATCTLTLGYSSLVVSCMARITTPGTGSPVGKLRVTMRNRELRAGASVLTTAYSQTVSNIPVYDFREDTQHREEWAVI